MLNKFLSLLERLVVALETQAEAAKVMAHRAGVNVNLTTVDPEFTSSFTIEGAEPGMSGGEVHASTTSSADASWNPLAEKPMGRYTREKTAILDAMLAERGIDATKARTGQEKHTLLLLKWGEDKAAEAQDTAVPPTAATAPASSATAPSAPAATPANGGEPVTLAECHKLAAQFNAAGHSVDEIKKAIAAVNGGVKLGNTKPEDLPAVKAALLAAFGGGQAQDEEGW